jgi:GxxExxY protein
MLTEARPASSTLSAMTSEDCLTESARTRSVIGAFFEVYNSLGFGFLEHVYSAALELELTGRGHRVGREVSVAISYKGREISRQRLDMIVDDMIVVELKATEVLPPASLRQVFSYLRATYLRIGLLFHFGPTPAVRRVEWRGARLRRVSPYDEETHA